MLMELTMADDKELYNLVANKIDGQFVEIEKEAVKRFEASKTKAVNF
jgi:hypothetical protein